MGEAIVALLSGGATGLLGTALTGVLGFFKQKQANKQMLQMREMDLKEIELEAASAEKRMALDAEREALSGSYADARTFISKGMELTKGQKWIVVFVDLVRGLMRPAITIYFMVMAFSIYGVDDDLTRATILYISTSTILWWFGTRPNEKGNSPQK